MKESFFWKALYVEKYWLFPLLTISKTDCIISNLYVTKMRQDKLGKLET